MASKEEIETAKGPASIKLEQNNGELHIEVLGNPVALSYLIANAIDKNEDFYHIVKSALYAIEESRKRVNNN